jgi:hypothetical protein
MYRQRLSKAIEEQQLIGWDMAFRGFLSSTWLQAQHSEHPKSSIIGLRNQWIKPVIQAIWKVSLSHWEARNGTLHSNQAQAQQIRESSIDAKVRTQYTNKAIFATADQVLFNVPLEIHLKKSSRDKRHWLSLVAHYHPTTIARRHGNQPLITQFFGVAIIEHDLPSRTQTSSTTSLDPPT